MTSQKKKAYLERYKEANREIDRLCEIEETLEESE